MRWWLYLINRRFYIWKLIEESPCWKKSTSKVISLVPFWKELLTIEKHYEQLFNSKNTSLFFPARQKKEMFLFIQFVRRDRWKCTYSLLDVMIILAVFMTKNKWLKFFQAVFLCLNAVGAGSIDAFQTYTIISDWFSCMQIISTSSK